MTGGSTRVEGEGVALSRAKVAAATLVESSRVVPG